LNACMHFVRLGDIFIQGHHIITKSPLLALMIFVVQFQEQVQAAQTQILTMSASVQSLTKSLDLKVFTHLSLSHDYGTQFYLACDCVLFILIVYTTGCRD
jgi:hypothetical protein